MKPAIYQCSATGDGGKGGQVSRGFGDSHEKVAMGISPDGVIHLSFDHHLSTLRYRPMPVVNNEDDHENFDKPKNNFTVSIAEHVSWGWFDYRRKGEGPDEGYQSPPVNWGISSERIRGFFNLCKEISGIENP